MTTETLTRNQAIKRIRDINSGVQVDHFMDENDNGTIFELSANTTRRANGAIAELMAIFDIKQEEL